MECGMAYEDMKQNSAARQVLPKKAHNLAMEDRRRLSVSGVEDVESFDEREIVMRTSGGGLVIVGEGLSISRLSVDAGDVNVSGLISELRYEEESARRGGLWARLFH